MPFGKRRANTTFGQTGGGYANGGTQYSTGGDGADRVDLDEMMTGYVVSPAGSGRFNILTGRTWRTRHWTREKLPNKTKREFIEWAKDKDLPNTVYVYAKDRTRTTVYHKMVKKSGSWVNQPRT